MKKTVLIIDDDESLRNALADRIESMGFECDQADSQRTAEDLLRKHRYDLILLDQELPTRKGKPTHKQVGRNLLERIREEGLNEKSPVIIVTAHDDTDPMVACDLIHTGADYFLPKPKIDQLEVKVRETLARRKLKSHHTSPARTVKEPALTPFPGGLLEFQKEGVFLDSIRLASTSSTIGRILLELARQGATGKRRGRSGKSLAESLNLARGGSAITEAISPFRKQTVEQLRNAGFQANADSVIVNGRGGYELAPNIEVTAEAVENLPADEAAGLAQKDRVAWFVAEAKAGRKPCKALYLRKFKVSEATWKRDLKLLTEQLEVVGTGGAAYYRPKFGNKTIDNLLNL